MPVLSLSSVRTVRGVSNGEEITYRAMCSQANCATEFDFRLIAKRRRAGGSRTTLASRAITRAIGTAEQRVAVRLGTRERRRLQRELKKGNYVTAEMSATASGPAW